MVDLFFIARGSKRQPPGFFRDCKGFTLLELLLSLFMVGVLTAIFGMGLVAAVQNFNFSRHNAHIAQKTQVAMARLSRELMELTQITSVSGDGEDPYIIYDRLIEGNPPSVMRFGVHHHPDDGTIRLYTNLNTAETSLGSGTITQGDILLDGVSDLLMDYNEGTTEWTFTDSPNNTQQLSSIELTLTLDRPDNPEQPQLFEAIIHLRNNNNFGGAAPTTTPASRDDYTCFIRMAQGDANQ